MSLRCFLGVHQPSLSSIARRGGGLIGLCESCGRPLLKQQDAKWTAAPPLDRTLRES